MTAVQQVHAVARLERTAFTTSRMLEFFSEKELPMQLDYTALVESRHRDPGYRVAAIQGNEVMTQEMRLKETYQVMPSMPPEQFEALKADIADRCVIVIDGGKL